MFDIINFARIGNHPVELIITLVQALLLSRLARLLSVVNTAAIWVLLTFILFLILTCVAVGILVVHLLKVEILDDLLHFLDDIRLAYQILTILLG